MKIGVDARLLSRPLTGIGRYLLEMCRALSKIDKVDLYLFSPARILPNNLPGLESAKLITSQSDKYFFSRQIWSKCILPFLVRSKNIDVFWGPAHSLPPFLPQRLARVVTIHDLVWKFAPSTMRTYSYLLERFQMPYSVNSADLVVVASHATAAAALEEFNLDETNITVVSPGAGIQIEYILNDACDEQLINKDYFLFVGTLEPRKNLSRLLIAYSKLSVCVREQANLVIVGGKGWGKVDVYRMLEELDLAKYVVILGYVDDSNLLKLYKNAKFLAMPSLYEGFGLPILEAMVHGIPVLTSNNSSMPEVAGNAGLFVDAKDVDSIKSSLEILITNKSVREKLAKNAKLNAERFDWYRSATALFSVIVEAVSKKDRRLL